MNNGHSEIVRLLLAAGADPIVAWEKTNEKSRKFFMTTLDACGDALTQEQRDVLIAASRPDEFARLRAALAASNHARRLQR